MLRYGRPDGIPVAARMPRWLVYLARDPPRCKPAGAADRDRAKDHVSQVCFSA